MSRLVDCSTPAGRAEGLEAAAAAIRRGELVVMPTDTVYGVAADAFTPSAVTALLAAKGRGKSMPPPVLVGSVRAANALIDDLGPYGQDLIEEFWPGALTLVCRSTPSLAWDLGETKGTVAVRMPFHQLALELLKDTGPMAVSSANRTGEEAARTAQEARAQLGDAVAVYLDDGRSGAAPASSIVDLTGPVPGLLRPGAVSEERLRDVLGVLVTDDDDDDGDDDAADDDGDVAAEAGGEARGESGAAADPAGSVTPGERDGRAAAEEKRPGAEEPTGGQTAGEARPGKETGKEADKERVGKEEPPLA